MKRNPEFPKASIIKVAKGNFKVLTKKSFMAKSEEVEKHFKSQTKAIEWAMSHGYNAEWYYVTKEERRVARVSRLYR